MLDSHCYPQGSLHREIIVAAWDALSIWHQFTCTWAQNSAQKTDSETFKLQGYSGQHEDYMNGYEATIDQAEMGARGIMSGQQSRGEQSGLGGTSQMHLMPVSAV